MLFWPFFLIGTVVITLLVATADERLMLPRTEHEVARLVVIVSLFSLMAITLFMRWLTAARGRWLVRATVCLGVGLAGWTGYAMRHEINRLAERFHGELVPSVALSRRVGEVELRRNWDGHFRADARVNGRRIRMMVDTGATLVLIPFERAAAIGIDPEVLRFSMPVSTANGPARVAPVRLTTVQVGPIVVRDVQAAVAQRGRLETPLLGLSFLEGVDEASFRGDTLTLRQGAEEPRSVILMGDGRERYVPLRLPQVAESHQSGFAPGYGSGLK